MSLTPKPPKRPNPTRAAAKPPVYRHVSKAYQLVREPISRLVKDILESPGHTLMIGANALKRQNRRASVLARKAERGLRL